MTDAEKLEIAVRALRFYARVANWRNDDWNVPGVIRPEYGSPGRRARNALKCIGHGISTSRRRARKEQRR